MFLLLILSHLSWSPTDQVDWGIFLALIIESLSNLRYTHKISNGPLPATPLIDCRKKGRSTVFLSRMFLLSWCFYAVRNSGALGDLLHRFSLTNNGHGNFHNRTTRLLVKTPETPCVHTASFLLWILRHTIACDRLLNLICPKPAHTLDCCEAKPPLPWTRGHDERSPFCCCVCLDLTWQLIFNHEVSARWSYLAGSTINIEINGIWIMLVRQFCSSLTTEWIWASALHFLWTFCIVWTVLLARLSCQCPTPDPHWVTCKNISGLDAGASAFLRAQWLGSLLSTWVVVLGLYYD